MFLHNYIDRKGTPRMNDDSVRQFVELVVLALQELNVDGKWKVQKNAGLVKSLGPFLGSCKSVGIQRTSW